MKRRLPADGFFNPKIKNFDSCDFATYTYIYSWLVETVTAVESVVSPK